jgi:hypothetical protein
VDTVGTDLLSISPSSLNYNKGVGLDTTVNFTVPTGSNSINFPDASGEVIVTS